MNRKSEHPSFESVKTKLADKIVRDEAARVQRHIEEQAKYLQKLRCQLSGN